MLCLLLLYVVLELFKNEIEIDSYTLKINESLTFCVDIKECTFSIVAISLAVLLLLIFNLPYLP